MQSYLLVNKKYIYLTDFCRQTELRKKQKARKKKQTKVVKQSLKKK